MSPVIRYSLMAVLALAPAPVLFAQDDSADAQPQEENKPATQPVDYRKLKELIPGEIAGIQRTNVQGEKTGYGDIKWTRAEGDYSPESEAENPPSARIEVMDMSAAQDMAGIASAWSQMEIDREGDDGYEKTTTVHGQPAFEKFTNDGQSGELQVYVDKRFIVTLSTYNVPADKFQAAIQELPIEKLVELKP